MWMRAVDRKWSLAATAGCIVVSLFLLACGGEEVDSPDPEDASRQATAWYSKVPGEACTWSWQCRKGLVCRSSTGREGKPDYRCLAAGHWGDTCLPNIFTDVGYDDQCASDDPEHILQCGQGLLYTLFGVNTCVYEVNL